MPNTGGQHINAKDKLYLARFGCCLRSFKHIHLMVSYKEDFCRTKKKSL